VARLEFERAFDQAGHDRSVLGDLLEDARIGRATRLGPKRPERPRSMKRT
jgi:hypothetical protein